MEGVSPAPKKAPPRTLRSVLFMCRMNAVRSPMAETIARSLLPGTYIASAGIRPGERDPFVDAVLDEVGLSLGRHAPHSLDELEDDYFDLIVTLAPEAHHAALELTRSMAVDVMYWPTRTRDQIMSSYREVREFLKMLIEKRLKASG